MTLSSDLFSDELSTVGEVVWVSGGRLGVLFLEEAKRGAALSPAAWLQRVLEHGRLRDRAGNSQDPERVVPVVSGKSGGRPALSIHSRRRSG